MAARTLFLIYHRTVYRYNEGIILWLLCLLRQLDTFQSCQIYLLRPGKYAYLPQWRVAARSCHTIFHVGQQWHSYSTLRSIYGSWTLLIITEVVFWMDSNSWLNSFWRPKEPNQNFLCQFFLLQLVSRFDHVCLSHFRLLNWLWIEHRYHATFVAKLYIF